MPGPNPISSQIADMKTTARRQLLRSYVDLAFAKEDLIMCGTKTGTGVGSAVADYFTFGLTTLIVKSVEAPAISAVRATRRTQAAQMFKDIDKLPPAKLEALATAAKQQDEPGFDWIKSQLTTQTTASASAASAATSTTGSIVQETFLDYIQDGVFDQAASFVPFGIGASIGAAKGAAQIAQVTQRIVVLKAKIQALKLQTS